MRRLRAAALRCYALSHATRVFAVPVAATIAGTEYCGATAQGVFKIIDPTMKAAGEARIVVASALCVVSRV